MQTGKQIICGSVSSASARDTVCLTRIVSRQSACLPAAWVIHTLWSTCSRVWTLTECGCKKGNKLETSILVSTEIFYFSKIKKKNATHSYYGYLFKIVKELFIVSRIVEWRDCVRWVGPLTKQHYRNVVNVSQGTRRWSVHINPGFWLTDKTGPSSRF